MTRHATYATYHSSGSWGAVAGAAFVARLLGCGRETTRRAMGTAEYHAPIAPMMKGIETPSMGKDSIGWGCMVAMSSVLLAMGGFTGITPLFNDAPDPALIPGTRPALPDAGSLLQSHTQPADGASQPLPVSLR